MHISFPNHMAAQAPTLHTCGDSHEHFNNEHTYFGLGRLSRGLLSPSRLLMGDLLFGEESVYSKGKTGKCRTSHHSSLLHVHIIAEVEHGNCCAVYVGIVVVVRMFQYISCYTCTAA